jgi:hypothetical protein
MVSAGEEHDEEKVPKEGRAVLRLQRRGRGVGAKEVSAFLEAFDRAGSGATTEGDACQIGA